jgi:tripartite-type tricarboxylate transporter receptor subunit TctC
MRNIVKFLSAISLALAFGTAHSTKSIEIVVPYTAGGAVDQNARALSQILTNNNITNFITYRPGAEGDIAYRYVVDQQDNVILAGTHATFIFSHVNQKRKNFYPTTLDLYGPITMTPQGFLTGPNGFVTYRTLIQEAKQKELPCGVSNSTGTVMLLHFNKKFNTKFVPIPYKGSAPMASDISGNHIRCGFDSLSSHYSRHVAKHITILSSSFYNKISVPLISDEIPANKLESWYGFALPKNGNLAKNTTLIDIFQSMSNNQVVFNQLIESGFIPTKINPNLDREVSNQVEYYNKIMQ